MKADRQRAILKMERNGLLRRMIATGAVLFVLFGMVFGITKVKGEDMAPALRDGDIVLYFRLWQEYDPGDVLFYECRGEKLFGRVAAAAGTTLDRSEGGVLLINGRVHPPQKKQGLFYETYARSRVQYPVKVPQEAFFVLGDRRSEAKDSRDFGPVKEKEIKGKVVIVIRKKNI